LGVYLWGSLLADGMTEIEIISLCYLSTFAWTFPAISAVHFLSYTFLATTFWSRECVMTGTESLLSSGSGNRVQNVWKITKQFISWVRAKPQPRRTALQLQTQGGSVSDVIGTLFRMSDTFCWTVCMNILLASARSTSLSSHLSKRMAHLI
jgi:hypothetical protein